MGSLKTPLWWSTDTQNWQILSLGSWTTSSNIWVWCREPTGRTDNSCHAPATLKWICEANTVTGLINRQCQLVSASESTQNAVPVRISCDVYQEQGRTGQLCLKFTLPCSVLAGTISLPAYTGQRNRIMGKYVSVSGFIRTGYSSRPTLQPVDAPFYRSHLGTKQHKQTKIKYCMDKYPYIHQQLSDRKR